MMMLIRNQAASNIFAEEIHKKMLGALGSDEKKDDTRYIG
jgi:hypothetical protein